VLILTGKSIHNLFTGSIHRMFISQPAKLVDYKGIKKPKNSTVDKMLIKCS